MSTTLIAKDFIHLCRGTDYKIATRLEALYWAFGWQGGTIHQLEKETGLSVAQLMDLDDCKFYSRECNNIYSEYSKGWFAVRTSTIQDNYDMNFGMAIRKGNGQFWQGVADGIFNEFEAAN